MNTKYVYTFGDGKAEGKADMRNLLGGKGANLAEMNLIGLPVPAGFTITTEVCTIYNQQGKDAVVKLIENDVKAGIAHMEHIMNAKFGSKGEAFPLMVSVRSGARVSMPGMMDTVLNLGLNDDAVQLLAEKSGNARFAWDSYRRFIQMYGDVVMGVTAAKGEHNPFEVEIDKLKEAKHIKQDTEFTVEDLQVLVGRFKDMGTTVGSHLRRVRFMDDRTRRALPPIEPNPGRMGNRRKRAVHGIWQHGQQFCHRRCLYP